MGAACACPLRRSSAAATCSSSDSMSDDAYLLGRATAEGTRRYAERFPELPGHFRSPDRLTLPSLALGMRNGDAGGVDDLLYRSAVSRLLEGGVHFFATALSERSQVSERNLGVALARAFREGLAQRDEVVVLTKGGYLTVDHEVAGSYSRARRYLVETYIHSGLVDPTTIAGGVHCLSPAFLRDQIRRSRRNLGLGTIDYYLIEEPELHLGEASADEFRSRICAAFEALEGAVADGEIAAYGVATWAGLIQPHTERRHLSLLDLFEWALDVGGGDHHLRAVQLPYNVAMAEALMLDTQIGPTGDTQAILSELRGTGTLVLASAPLAAGRVIGRLPGFVHDAFPGMRTDAQRCLQFVRSSPGIDVAVVGMRGDEHVEENLAMLTTPPVGPEVIERLFKRDAAS
jgi:aryl-alcohol dehydrogenase-like predicted oxidoreductase